HDGRDAPGDMQRAPAGAARGAGRQATPYMGSASLLDPTCRGAEARRPGRSRRSRAVRYRCRGMAVMCKEGGSQERERHNIWRKLDQAWISCGAKNLREEVLKSA